MNSLLTPPRGDNPGTRIWVISDLQSAELAEVEQCLGTAIDDLRSLDTAIDQIWYLGDGVVGSDLERNRAIVEVQTELLESLETPLRYVMGNHDLDHAKSTGTVSLPLYEAVRDHPDWRTTTSSEDFYFVEEFDDFTVLFLSDHVDSEGRWSVTHGRVHGDRELYPYGEAEYRAVIDDVTGGEKPIVIAGHNAFPGGNRPAALQRQFFPLPEEVLVHCYGHAHIGDERIVSQHAYRTISSVDHHDVPQVNVSSLEDRRGDSIRSALFEIDSAGNCAVHVRDHSSRSWLESYHLYSNSRRYVASVRSGETVVQRFSSRTQNQQLATVVDFLVEEYDLGSHLETPYVVDDSTVLLNDEPVDGHGEAMSQPYEVVDGTYLERHFDKHVKVRLLEELATVCGVELECGGLWSGAHD